MIGANFEERIHSQSGMSLIEVLVALLILGIGVMGFIALQLRSVETTDITYSRTQAMAIARDIIERINANPDAWPSGYDETANKWSGAVEKTDPLLGLCISDNCAGEDVAEKMAQMDVAQVKHLSQKMLFDSEITVEAQCNGEEVACVKVTWEGTSVGDCDPEAVNLSGENENANCVIVEFWPFVRQGGAV